MVDSGVESNSMDFHESGVVNRDCYVWEGNFHRCTVELIFSLLIHQKVEFHGTVNLREKFSKSKLGSSHSNCVTNL